MSEEDSSNASDNTTDSGQDPAQPPWESDKDFNPEKAWKLIQDLRSQKSIKGVAPEVHQELSALRTKLREAEPYVTKAKELEEQSKTETQRLSEQAKSHESRAEKAESQLMRLQVGIDKGLTPSQAKRLVGSTQEELEADADDLLASFGGKPSSKRPSERLRGGGDPEEDPAPDLRKIAAGIPRR